MTIIIRNIMPSCTIRVLSCIIIIAIIFPVIEPCTHHYKSVSERYFFSWMLAVLLIKTYLFYSSSSFSSPTAKITKCETQEIKLTMALDLVKKRILYGTYHFVIL